MLFQRNNFLYFVEKKKGWMEVRVINSAQRTAHSTAAETGLARDRLVSCAASNGKEETRKIKKMQRIERRQRVVPLIDLCILCDGDGGGGTPPEPFVVPIATLVSRNTHHRHQQCYMDRLRCTKLLRLVSICSSCSSRPFSSSLFPPPRFSFYV